MSTVETDYRRIAEDIQMVLSADADPDDSELAALEEEYAEAVEQVNSRLLQCEQLMEKGHRAEALQQCVIEPNLLDAVATLNFPELEQWSDYVRQFDLPAPPELRLHICDDLNDAFLAEQPLEGLMRANRVHALARSPLPRRIGILRQIAEIDESNPIWDEDLQTFEKARHTQLERDVKQAAKQADLDALSALEQEICEPAWRVQPPSRLKSLVKSEHTRIRAKRSREEMEKLAHELSRAHSEFSVEAGRTARERWNALVAITGIDAGDPLNDLASPVLLWLEEQDIEEQQQYEYETAVSQLEHALDEGAGRLELDRLYHAAIRNDRELSPVLKTRLSERVLALERAQSRRNRLFIVAGVLGVIVLGAMIAFGVRYEMNRRAIVAAVGSLQSQLDAGQHAQMQKYLDDLKENSPDIYDDAEVRQLEASLVAAVGAEADRRASVQAVVDAVGGHFGNPVWDSAPPVEQQHWDLVAVATADLEGAQELGPTESEQIELAELKRQIGQKRRSLQRLVDDEFNEDLNVLVERLRDEGNDMDELKALFVDFQALEQRGRVSRELVAQVDPLVAKIRTEMSTYQRRQEEVRRLRRITERTGNVRQFKLELERYINDFPEDSRAADFKRVIEAETALLGDVEAWNDFSRPWSGQDFASIEPRKARQFLEQAQAQRDNHPVFAGPELSSTVEAIAAAIGERLDENGNSIYLQLDELFGDPLVSGLYMVEATNSTRYYSLKPPTVRTDGFVCQYIRDMDAESVGTKLLPKRQVRTAVGAWKAPQSLFATQARQLLEEIDERGWEATFATMLQQLYTDEAMDPILKLWLLQPIVQTACRGSWFLSDHYQNQLRIIEEGGDEVDFNVNWVDPDAEAQKEADKVRRDARDVLRKLRTFAVPPDALQQATAELKNPALKRQYRWIGWLHRKLDDSWACSLRPTARRDQDGRLMMIHIPEGSETAKFEQVGELTQEQVSLSPALSASFVQGRPIFLERSE